MIEATLEQWAIFIAMFFIAATCFIPYIKVSFKTLLLNEGLESNFNTWGLIKAFFSRDFFRALFENHSSIDKKNLVGRRSQENLIPNKAAFLIIIFYPLTLTVYFVLYKIYSHISIATPLFLMPILINIYLIFVSCNKPNFNKGKILIVVASFVILIFLSLMVIYYLLRNDLQRSYIQAVLWCLYAIFIYTSLYIIHNDNPDENLWKPLVCLLGMFLMSVCFAGIVLYQHDKNLIIGDALISNRVESSKNFYCYIKEDSQVKKNNKIIEEDKIDNLLKPACKNEKKLIKELKEFFDQQGEILGIKIIGLSDNEAVSDRIKLEIKRRNGLPYADEDFSILDLKDKDNAVVALYRGSYIYREIGKLIENEKRKTVLKNEEKELLVDLIVAPERYCDLYKAKYKIEDDPNVDLNCKSVIISIDYSPNKPFSLLDSTYFVTYTMTTTGYGDYQPADDFTKFFTIVMNLYELAFITLVLSIFINGRSSRTR